MKYKFKDLPIVKPFFSYNLKMTPLKPEYVAAMFF